MALPEELTVEADPVVPLNRQNFILFREQEHKTKWMGALTDLLLVRVERMGVEDNKVDEGPGVGACKMAELAQRYRELGAGVSQMEADGVGSMGCEAVLADALWESGAYYL